MMLRLLAVLFVVLAAPLSAQQSECRGKTPVNLGGGVTGCIFKIDEGGITRSKSIEGGGPTYFSRSQVAAQVDVLLNGPHKNARSVTRSRILAICKAISDDIGTAMAGKDFQNVIVNLVWPHVEGSAPGQVFYRAGYTSANCRGVRFFGT